jgi:hypothetical protein
MSALKRAGIENIIQLSFNNVLLALPPFSEGTERHEVIRSAGRGRGNRCR